MKRNRSNKVKDCFDELINIYDIDDDEYNFSFDCNTINKITNYCMFPSFNVFILLILFCSP